MADQSQMIGRWEVVSVPPTRDARGSEIRIQDRGPTFVRYKGIEGRLFSGGLSINWPQQPDIHGLALPHDKAPDIIDYYLGHRPDWPFPWLRIIPASERAAVRADMDREQRERWAAKNGRAVAQETQPTAAVPAPQPIGAEVPEQKPVTTLPAAPVVSTPEPVQRARKPSKKERQQASRLSYDAAGRLTF